MLQNRSNNTLHGPVDGLVTAAVAEATIKLEASGPKIVSEGMDKFIRETQGGKQNTGQ